MLRFICGLNVPRYDPVFIVATVITIITVIVTIVSHYHYHTGTMIWF